MLIDEVPFLLWYYSFLSMPLLNLSKLAFIVFIIWNKDESDIIELAKPGYKGIFMVNMPTHLSVQFLHVVIDKFYLALFSISFLYSFFD
jgi:hypothetical protein